jgi:hypothetical protein
MEKNWKSKYLKYKSKYLKLKQNGGIRERKFFYNNVIFLKKSGSTLGLELTRPILNYSLCSYAFKTKTMIINYNKLIKDSISLDNWFYKIIYSDEFYHLSINRMVIYKYGTRFCYPFDGPDNENIITLAGNKYFFLSVEFSDALAIYIQTLEKFFSDNGIGKITGNTFDVPRESILDITSLNSTYNFLVIFKNLNYFDTIESDINIFTSLDFNVISELTKPFISLYSYIIHSRFQNKIPTLNLFYDCHARENISICVPKDGAKNIYGVPDELIIFTPQTEINNLINIPTVNEYYSKILEGRADEKTFSRLAKITQESKRLNNFINEFKNYKTTEGECKDDEKYLIKLNDSSTGKGIKKLSHCTENIETNIVPDYLENKIYIPRIPGLQNVKIDIINTNNLRHDNNNFFIQTLYESPFNLFENGHRVRCKLRFFWSPFVCKSDKSRSIIKHYGAMIYKTPDFEYYLSNSDISNDGRNTIISAENKKTIVESFNAFIVNPTGQATLKNFSTFLAETLNKTFLDSFTNNNMFLFMINGFDSMMTGTDNTVTGLSFLENNAAPVYLGEPSFVNSMYRSYLSVTYNLSNHINSLDKHVSGFREYEGWFINCIPY